MATTVLGLKTFTASDPVDYNEINDNYNKIDNGVKTAMQGRAAYNWLDNSNFTNPVNQRCQTQKSENGYFIDRWTNYAGSQELVAGGVQTTASGNTAYLSQYIESAVLHDGVYSFAAKVNGSVHIRVIRISGTTITTVSNAEAGFKGGYLNAIYANSGRFEFMLRVEDGNSIVTEWTALYEGSYTADTLPAYVPKDNELAECRRYYKVIDVYVAPWLLESTTMRRYYVGYEPMRTAPTVDVSGLKEYSIWTALESAINPYNIKNNRVLLSANAETTSTRLYIGGSIALSADL